MNKEEEAIASLWLWDVHFLAADPSLKKPLPPEDLLERLIGSGSGRVRLGVVAFFLRHPELAGKVHPVLSKLGDQEALLLKYYYTAAVYLQRYWETALWTKDSPALPDYFSQELGLPPPSLLHGKIGLWALEEALQGFAGQPFNYFSSFNSVAQILMQAKPTHARDRQ